MRVLITEDNYVSISYWCLIKKYITEYWCNIYLWVLGTTGETSICPLPMTKFREAIVNAKRDQFICLTS